MREGAVQVTFFSSSVLIAVSATLLAYRKASFPKKPTEFWSQHTIESVLRTAPSILDVQSENIPGLIELGIACYQKGPDSYVEGLKALERARYLGALDERIFWYAARMYEEKGLTRFALEDYERYLRYHPSDISTQLSAASLFYKDGDSAKAFKHYEIVLMSWPENLTALFNVASIYNQAGDYAKAQPFLEKYRSLSGDLPPRGHYMLGQAYELRGLNQEAVTEYEKEFRRNESDPSLLKALAGAYGKTGQNQKAREIWQIAFKLNPRDSLIRSKLAKHNASRKRRK